MRLKRPFVFVTRGLIIGMGVLYISNTLATIDNVGSISEKEAGDRFFYSDFNSIVNILKSFFHDDNGTTGDLTDDKISIGTSTPDRLFHIEASDSSTNGITYAQRFSHVSSGTVAANFGVGLEFELESAEGNNAVVASISTILTDATNSAEEGALVFYTADIGDDGLAERMRIDDSGYVGIGTTTPASELDVSGTVRTNQLCDESGTNCKDLSANEWGGMFLGRTTTNSISGVTASSLNSNGKTNGVITATVNSVSYTGYSAANAICNAAFSGSHLCTQHSILTTVHASSDVTAIDGWDGTVWVNAGGSKYALTTTFVDDCEGWTSSASNHVGNFWNLGNGTDDKSGGVGGATDCSLALSLSCCK